MKQKSHNPFLRFSAAAILASALTLAAHAADLTWNAALPGNWDTTNTNWSGSTWNNATPDNAILNNLNGTITLTQLITAGSLSYNNGGNPSGSHELTLTGSNLSVGSVTSWGGYNPAGGGGGVDNITQAYSQRLTFNSINLNVSGDAIAKRGMLYLLNATMNVGGTIKSTDAWSVFRADNSTVSAPNGIDLSTIACQLELYGGTITTPFLKVGNAAFAGQGGLALGGGVKLVPTAASADYIQVYNNGDTNSRAAAGLSSGGVEIDTAYAVTVATQLVGGGSVTKSGSGTLTLTQSNNYTGGTTVNQGMLVLNSGAWTFNNVGGGGVTVGSGATLRADNSVANQLNGLTLNGGTVEAINSSGNGDWGNFFLTGNVTATGTSSINADLALRASTVNFDVATGGTLSVGGLMHGGVNFTNAGISKSGDGTLALTAAHTYTGDTTVNAGTLSLGNGTTNSNLSDGSTVSIASGALVNLNFSGTDTVGKLIIEGNTMSGGTYNAGTHPLFFTGTGSLTVLNQNGTWTSTASGNWGTSSNWLSNTIATGIDKTATFSAGTGSESITVTLDTARQIGNLAFSNANYTLSGSNTLTLDSTSTPAISVAAGLTTTVSTNLSGTVGLVKTGAGTLSLSAGAGDNYANVYNHNISGGMNITQGTVEFASQYIKMGSITIGNGATLKTTQPWATGSSNPWFNGRSAGSITVEAGGTLTSTTIANALVEGLTLNGGSVTAPSVTSGDWGAFIIASTVTADGATTSSISAELAVTGNQSFYVVTGSTLNVSGVVHNRAGAAAGAITKEGSGTLTLGGANTYSGNTLVNDGALNVTGTLSFYPGASGSTNSVSAGTATATLSFTGTVNLDLSAAAASIGNSWPLINVASFTAPPVVTPAAVTSTLGSFIEVTPGTWELPVTGAKWVFTKATGSLTYLNAATPYETWGSTYGLTAGSEGGDLDNDGLTNFQEFAFGLIPNSGSSVNPITAQLDKTTGQFTYQRLAASGLTYSIWTSPDLVTWTQDNTAGQVATPAGNNESVAVTLTGPLTASKLFVRVKAQ